MPSLLINKRQKITTVTRLAAEGDGSLIEHPEIFSDMESIFYAMQGWLKWLNYMDYYAPFSH